jgi:serine/threonine protein kinase
MLTDFGLSREGVKKADTGARSFCGSYAYLAPEMVRKTGHGKTVDWYLLGVILYEMLTGLPPYYADDKNILFENILTQEFTIEHANLNLSDECVDLLKQLLQKDP